MSNLKLKLLYKRLYQTYLRFYSQLGKTHPHNLKTLLLLLVWLFIGTALRLTNLAAKPPWTDEFSTLVFSLGNSFRTVPLDRAIALDVLLQPLQPNPDVGVTEVLQHLLTESNHPPLYFMLAHWWMQLWQPDAVGLASIWAARSLSALFGAASILAIYGLGWLAFRSQLASQLAAAMMAVSPYGIFLAQEARHYTLAILWVIASLGCVVIASRHIQRRTPLPSWIIASWIGINIFGISTHYFFSLTLCAEAMVLIALRWHETEGAGEQKRNPKSARTEQSEEDGKIQNFFNPPFPWLQISLVALATLIGGLFWLMVLLALRWHDRGGAGEQERNPKSKIQNFLIPRFPWWQISLVTLATLIGGLFWLPIFLQNTYGGDLTEWIQSGDRIGLAWLNPIFQALAAWITMLSLLPVEAAALPVVIASGAVMIIFFLWALPILYRGFRTQLKQPATRLTTQIFAGVVLGAIALFFFFTYAFGIDLTRGARYNFVYFPAVIVLLGASLAVYWNIPPRLANLLLKRQKFFLASGKISVALIWLMGLVSAVTVVCNLGYQKYYRPDLLVQQMQKVSHVPTLIATTHKTHVQIGEMMGIAREFKLSRSTATPQFLLVHQDQDGNTPKQVLQQTLTQLPRPLDLWLVNFYAPVEINNCIAESLSLPAVNGYDYQLYRCYGSQPSSTNQEVIPSQ